MGELVSSLGINGGLFFAQLVNFSILLYVLYRFAYTPVLKMLEERTNKIEKGLADAEASQKKLEEAAEKEKEVLIEAKKQAKEILEKADTQAQAHRAELLETAKQESDRILTQAQKITAEQKDQMVNEVKAEVAGLVAVALEKVVDEKMDADKDAKIINDVIKTQ